VAIGNKIQYEIVGGEMFSLAVKNNSNYREVMIIDFNMSITTGLLDEGEVMDMAQQLINAAEELLPIEYGEQKTALALIREALDK